MPAAFGPRRLYLSIFAAVCVLGGIAASELGVMVWATVKRPARRSPAVARVAQAPARAPAIIVERPPPTPAVVVEPAKPVGPTPPAPEKPILPPPSPPAAVAPPPEPAPAFPPADRPRPLMILNARTFARMDRTSEDDLRQQLDALPKVGLYPSGVQQLCEQWKKSPSIPVDFGPRALKQMAYLQKQSEQAQLPWREGGQCKLGVECGQRLQVLSKQLRDTLRQSVPAGDQRPDCDDLRQRLLRDSPGTAKAWREPGAVPVLVQLLGHETVAVRTLLVELLEAIPGSESSQAIARRATFDLAPAVRERAVAALHHRPYDEYGDLLVETLEYPWPPAAEHAAEALAVLSDPPTLGQLVNLLERLDAPAESARSTVREVVAINHLSNCLLCHAPSHSSDDLARGQVMVPGEPPPPLYYGGSSTSKFVRADVTYLKQDFSVVQPVLETGTTKWPGQQRFDYLARTRTATAKEKALAASADSARRRDAVRFALERSTGQHFDDVAGWRRALSVGGEPTSSPRQATLSTP